MCCENERGTWILQHACKFIAVATIGKPWEAFEKHHTFIFFFFCFRHIPTNLEYVLDIPHLVYSWSCLSFSLGVLSSGLLCNCIMYVHAYFWSTVHSVWEIHLITTCFCVCIRWVGRTTLPWAVKGLDVHAHVCSLVSSCVLKATQIEKERTFA